MNVEEGTARLLARLKAGKNREEDFAELFRRYHDRVYRWFPRSVTPAVRSELTQEVFFKVSRHMESLPDERFEAWLHRVARRTFLSWYESETRLKRRGTVVPWEDGEAQADLQAGYIGKAAEASPLEDTLNAERKQVLRAAIEELPAQMRSCVLLRIVHDRTIEEVARALRLAPGTVKAHLHAARARLKPRLAAYFSDIDLVGGDPP